MQTLKWGFRPLPFMQDCREKFGGSFSVKFLGFKSPMVMISDPEAIKALYTERSNGLPPGRNVVLGPIMGPRSVLLLEGDEHLARRKLMLPPFHGERMRAYQPIVEQIVTDEVDSWPLGEEFPIHSRMQAVTLEVILRVVFGVADGPRLERLRGMLGRVLAETASPAAQLIGLASQRFGGRGPWAKFEAQLRAVDELLYAEIGERRSDPGLEDRDDILSALMLARFEDGGGMSDSELRDQLMTLLLAGHETTVNLIANGTLALLGNPDQVELLRSEPSLIETAIEEVLRYDPPVQFTGRVALEDVEIADIVVPAGRVALTLLAAANRDPEQFDDPGRLDITRDPNPHLAFGTGIHLCLGAPLARAEGQIAIASLFDRFPNLAPATGGLEYKENVVLRGLAALPLTI